MTLPNQNGGLRELLIPNDPTEIMRQLSRKDFHAANFPQDSVDKGPTTAPLGPVARVTTKTHQLEYFMCSADFPTDQQTLQNNASRGVLTAGSRHIFRATFQPQYWEIYTFKVASGTVGDLLYYTTLSDAPALPADVLVVTADISVKGNVPGRGLSLCVWTPSGNAGAVSLVARAISNLATSVSGAIDE